MTDLYRLLPKEMEKMVIDMGYDRYRADQILIPLYRKFPKSIADIKQLPKEMIAELVDAGYTIGSAKEVHKITSDDGDTTKVLLNLTNDKSVEIINKYIDNIDTYYKKHIKHGFHIHAPAGGTPKDGPSAGCTFTCAFISRILNKSIKNDIAMTGEIDLMGNVTKIGGLEFKLQGAKKAGVKTVYVSHENEDDIKKIKKKYKKLIDNNFKVITVKNIRDYIDDIFI